MYLIINVTITTTKKGVAEERRRRKRLRRRLERRRPAVVAGATAAAFVAPPSSSQWRWRTAKWSAARATHIGTSAGRRTASAASALVGPSHTGRRITVYGQVSLSGSRIFPFFIFSHTFHIVFLLFLATIFSRDLNTSTIRSLKIKNFIKKNCLRLYCINIIKRLIKFYLLSKKKSIKYLCIKVYNY